MQLGGLNIDADGIENPTAMAHESIMAARDAAAAADTDGADSAS